jgi:hypothetical protein
VVGDKLRHRFFAVIKTAIPGGTSAGDDFLIRADVALQVGCLSAKSARMGKTDKILKAKADRLIAFFQSLKQELAIATPNPWYSRLESVFGPAL